MRGERNAPHGVATLLFDSFCHALYRHPSASCEACIVIGVCLVMVRIVDNNVTPGVEYLITVLWCYSQRGSCFICVCHCICTCAFVFLTLAFFACFATSLRGQGGGGEGVLHCVCITKNYIMKGPLDP